MRHLLIAFIISIVNLSCQDNEPTSIHYTIHDKKVSVPYKNGELTFSMVSPHAFNIRYSDSLQYSNRDYALINETLEEIEVEEENSIISIHNNIMGLAYDLRDHTITLNDNEGNKKAIVRNPFERIGDTTHITFNLDEDEAIYGTGSRALPLNRRGYRLKNYNKAHYAYQMGADLLNYCIPHIMSSNEYMILFDNPAASFIDIGKKNSDELTFSSASGNMSFYLINGRSYEELITNYTDLTGKQPLPPIWTFGNLQSRFGYRNQEQTEGIFKKTLDAGYPIDAMILDIYWFGPELQDGKMGKLTWDSLRWPSPKSMIDKFNQNDVNTILVTEPFFTLKSGRFEYLEKRGLLAKDDTGNAMQMPYFYFGNTGLLDIFNPEAKKWIWKEYKRLKDFGIEGWWVDLGEPEVHPDSIVHINGLGKEVHGAYGHEWAKMLTQGYEKDFPDERLFHMGRAGFAGSQKYNLIPWSGDVSRTWSGLKAQLPIMLSMGISGIAYMHSDAGGFSNVKESNPELYTRWLQYAAFTPVFRPHADEVVAPEPITWPKEVQENVKPAIDLRYAMLPYNYTLAWKNSKGGLAMAKPMFLSYPHVSDTIMTQYMWGDDLLVSPILKPGEKLHETYLPEGSWYDFFSEEKYNGNTWIKTENAPDHIPVFVKEGSVIPLCRNLNSTSSYSKSDIELHYYMSDERSASQIYYDDGKTKNAYEKGRYRMVEILTNPTDGMLRFQINETGKGYEVTDEEKRRKMVIHGSDQSPKSVKVNKNEVEFDITDEHIRFDIPFEGNVEIAIKF